MVTLGTHRAVEPAFRGHVAGSVAKIRSERRGSGLRDLWEVAGVRDAGVALAPPDEAALEPEHPAGPRARERHSEADLGLHVVHSRRQGDEAASAASARLPKLRRSLRPASESVRESGRKKRRPAERPRLRIPHDRPDANRHP